MTAYISNLIDLNKMLNEKGLTGKAGYDETLSICVRKELESEIPKYKEKYKGTAWEHDLDNVEVY